MKHSTILMVLLGSLLVACRKDAGLINSPIVDVVDTTAQLQFRAQWMNGPYGTTSGLVKIYRQNNQYSLVLDSFSVNAGPDLHVYLSREEQPINFIDLGNLRATSGRQVYAINGMPNFQQFTFALIHCQQFDHLFGSAVLQ